MSVCIAYPSVIENFPDFHVRIKAKHFHQSICYYPLDSDTKLDKCFLKYNALAGYCKREFRLKNLENQDCLIDS